jgi:hypothetical protein
MPMQKKSLPPPSEQTRREVTESIKVIRSYVHLVLPQWNAKKEVGTAVMLRAGNHLFALTAEHCTGEGMTIRFRSDEGQTTHARILKVHTSKPLDIAVVELEDRRDVQACDIQQLSLELPSPATEDSDPSTEPLFWVVGYPTDRVQVSDEAVSVDEVAFGTNLVEVEADEFRLYYHEKSYGIGADTRWALAELPKTPHGFSGAGVWRFDHSEERSLFNPLQHVRLYGIQYAWLDITRRLRCVPSRTAAKILATNYPDLKEMVTRLFPALSQEQR